MKQVLELKFRFVTHCSVIIGCYIFLCYYSGPDVPVVELPEFVPYFDLEGFPGVEELKRKKDANSEPITIPVGILFGDRTVKTAYVSTFCKRTHCH